MSHVPIPDPWEPYSPSAVEPWNLARVVHLHRRAGFGANLAQLERDLGDGPETALARFLEGRVGDGFAPDFERTSLVLGDAATIANDALRLEAWWLWRMLTTRDPLGERLALAWHNHFATSNVKVMDLSAMRRQNELFRQHARGKFGTLLSAVVHDPALLVWLDAPSNRAEHPNENLARELMELFTLGVGNYAEHDVQEGARALTGWCVTADGRFYRSLEHHDGGEKTILGRTGTLDGDGLVALLLEQPAVAQRIAGRLGELFLCEELRTRERIESLAAELASHELDLGHAVALVLRSRTFFAQENLGGVVLGPAHYMVGAVRALEALDPPPSTLALAEWCGRMGQTLFHPPNVFGWEGGRTWISTGTLLARARFAAELASGSLGPPGSRPVEALAERHGLRDPAAMGTFLARLFLGAEGAPSTVAPAQDHAQAVARFLSSPRAQLC